MLKEFLEKQKKGEYISTYLYESIKDELGTAFDIDSYNEQVLEKLYEKYQELAQTPEFNTILNSLGGLNGAFSNVSNRENPPVSSGRPSESNTDMENSLKAMLTPQQLELFERLKASMNQPHD